MSLSFITGSKQKFEEIKMLVPDLEQVDIDLVEIQDIDPKVIIKHKLQEALKHHEGPFIVEDTSLYLDCLDGLPGPLIKWFMKTMGNEGLFEITEKFENSKAEAKTIIGYAKNVDDIHFFEGSVTGTIVSPREDDGFGWNAIFMPEGYDVVFSEMTKEEKNDISMRGQAAMRLKDFLK